MNKFGTHSMNELQGCRAELIIASTETLTFIGSKGFDMSVFDGLRTEAEQRKNIRRGVSWTMNSMHLPQADGLSHAVDLVPYIEGALRWDSEDKRLQKKIDDCFRYIHEGMMESAELHGFVLEWGFALWGKDKPHFQLRGG